MMTIPILDNKHFEDSSLFTPENLIREAQRQKNIKECYIPEICILDPDGDLVRFLAQKKSLFIQRLGLLPYLFIHIYSIPPSL